MKLRRLMRRPAALTAAILAAGMVGGALVADHTGLAFLGFSRGLKSLDVNQSTLAPAESLRAEDCGSCHQDVYTDWRTTRHAVAWTNDVFQDGFRADQRDTCVYCHAPLKEQSAEIFANWKYYADHRPPFAQLAMPPGTDLAREGVNCAVCHLRDGKILTANAEQRSLAHDFRYEPRLNDGSFCANCHEFNFPVFYQGKVAGETETPMQTTFTEWRNYSATARAVGRPVKNCRGCHMPGDRHTFRGAHDLKLLKSSIKIEAIRMQGACRFILRSMNTGHENPTGDLFRHYTLETAADGTTFRSVYRVGRLFRNEATTDGRIVTRLAENTALRPFEERLVLVPCEPHEPLAWRLRYHYTSEKDEIRGGLPLDRTIVTIADGFL